MMPWKGKSAPKPTAKTSDLNQGANFSDSAVNAGNNTATFLKNLKKKREMEKRIADEIGGY